MHMPKTGKVVLYVDLDGVLQHHHVLHHPKRGIYICPDIAPGRQLFEWAGYLEEALDPYPDVRCVLSSSWCVWPGYGKTMKRLPEGLRTRFIGGTFHRGIYGRDVWAVASFRQKPRWMQIWEDVQRRKPAYWLALDDDAAGWPAWMVDNLVACNSELGLSSPATRHTLAQRLRDVCSAPT